MTKDRQKPQRPIRRDEYRRLPITRVPSYEPLVPGLRKGRGELPSAIGFHVQQRLDEDEYED